MRTWLPQAPLAVYTPNGNSSSEAVTSYLLSPFVHASSLTEKYMIKNLVTISLSIFFVASNVVVYAADKEKEGLRRI
jgi:hypothetical protein